MPSRILLADDSPTIQKIARQTFEHEKVDLTCVGNGEAALQKLEEVHPDLVLADIFMPGKSGFEVCEFIKRHDRFSTVPVILLVGAFEPFDEKEAARVGADGHLKKPFASQMLLEVVRKFITDTSEVEKPQVSISSEKNLEGHQEEIGKDQTAEPQGNEVVETESPLETEYLLEPSGPAPEGELESIPAAITDEPVLDHPALSELPSEILSQSPLVSEPVSNEPPIPTSSPGSVAVGGVHSDEEIKPFVSGPEDIEQPAVSGENRDSLSDHSIPVSEEFADFQRNLVVEARQDLKTSASIRAESRPSDGVGDSSRGPATMEEVLGGKVPSIEASEAAERSDDKAVGSAIPELTEEAVDAIVRRVVERMSTRVVEDIAWEVVPQIAEVLILKKIRKES